MWLYRFVTGIITFDLRREYKSRPHSLCGHIPRMKKKKNHGRIVCSKVSFHCRKTAWPPSGTLSFLSDFQGGFWGSCSFSWLVFHSGCCFADNWLCFIHLLTTSKWIIFCIVCLQPYHIPQERKCFFFFKSQLSSFPLFGYFLCDLRYLTSLWPSWEWIIRTQAF